MSTIWYEGPADGGIKERYGLDEHECAPEPQVQAPSVDDGFEL